jgi:hypothetical protein
MNAQEHWNLFAKFCSEELASGGPDPQLALITHISKTYTDPERVWLAGCYGAHHCVGSAVAVWLYWDVEDVLNHTENFGRWIEEHWASLPVRPEMRSHRMVEKRVECLVDFARWAHDQSWKGITDYDSLWYDSQMSVKYFGRYMAIKFLELLRRSTNPGIVMPDMRAKGAWSPRRTLSWLFPALPRLADKDDGSPAALADMDLAASMAIETLSNRKIFVNYFQLQVMLCEYREALVGGYYPGGSHDEEMTYLDKVKGISDLNTGSNAFSMVYEARRTLFPKQFLGELNDWHGIREECKNPFTGGTE